MARNINYWEPQAGPRSMTKPGIDADGVAENEADHFMQCPVCSLWFDMPDMRLIVGAGVAWLPWRRCTPPWSSTR